MTHRLLTPAGPAALVALMGCSFGSSDPVKDIEQDSAFAALSTSQGSPLLRALFER